MRLEIVALMLSFGTSSLFWLLAAFRMETTVYGTMMQWQALLMVSAAFFAWRTHDLVFHLQKHHESTLRQAYFTAVKLEIALTSAGTVCAVLLLKAAPWFGIAEASSAALAIVLVSLLANLTVLQGSATAYLRTLQLDRRIAHVDLITGVCWSVAVGLLWVLPASMPMAVLTMGLAAASVRALALAWFAWSAARNQHDPLERKPLALDLRGLGKFLVAGQLTNFVKNNLLPLETLLLGRLAGADAVALFRLARSLLNLTTVMLNISYQKSFVLLVKAADTMARQQATRRMTRTSVLLWAGSLPIVFLVAYIFVLLRHDNAYDQLLVVLALAAVATLPMALQQSVFAALSLDGDFRRINIAYVIGLLALAGACVVFRHAMTVNLFIMCIAMSGFVRLFMMSSSFSWIPRRKQP